MQPSSDKLRACDEEALAEALSRGQLRRVALDVYIGEFERLPMDRLWHDRRVLITPHISGASDHNLHGAIDLFCDNLRAYLDGKPLQNAATGSADIEGTGAAIGSPQRWHARRPTQDVPQRYLRAVRQAAPD